MIHKRKVNKEGGYAILFAVVVVSIISMITLGLSNSTYKQLLLSSLANDSQIAYYQADTATECALYADNIIGNLSSLTTWQCGKYNNNHLTFTRSGAPEDIEGYKFTSNLANTSSPCFEFNIKKSSTPPLTTNVYGRGYNMCIKSNPRAVERKIQAYYQ